MLGKLLGGADPATLMSVGDIWVNDIAPALELGCATAFIDRSGRDLRPAHARGRTMQDLYPAIEAWARSPRDFAVATAPASTRPSDAESGARPCPARPRLSRRGRRRAEPRR